MHNALLSIVTIVTLGLASAASAHDDAHVGHAHGPASFDARLSQPGSVRKARRIATKPLSTKPKQFQSGCQTKLLTREPTVDNGSADLQDAVSPSWRPTHMPASAIN